MEGQRYRTVSVDFETYDRLAAIVKLNRSTFKGVVGLFVNGEAHLLRMPSDSNGGSSVVQEARVETSDKRELSLSEEIEFVFNLWGRDYLRDGFSLDELKRQLHKQFPNSKLPTDPMLADSLIRKGFENKRKRRDGENRRLWLQL